MGGLRIPNRILILVVGIIVAAGVLWTFAGLARYPQEEPKGEWLMWSWVNYDRLADENAGTERYAAMLKEARDLYPTLSRTLTFEGFDISEYVSPRAGHVYLEEGAVREGQTQPSGTNLALDAEREAKAERKLTLLRTILDEHPLPPWGDLAAMHLGYALVSLGRYEEAIPALERAMTSLHQEYSEIYIPLLLSRVYRRLKRYDDAERTLRRALEVSNSAYLRQALALVLEEKGDLAGALSIYERLVAGRNVDDYWHTRLAEKAQELYDQVHKRLDAEHGAVYGRIELNGVGLAKTRVYLVHDINRTVWLSPSIRAAETRTNDHGEFVIYGVPVGRYRIDVEVPRELVHGALVRFDPGVVRVSAASMVESNIAFERTPRILQAELLAGDPYPSLSIAWEPDPRAAAYTLLLNISVGASTSTYALPEHPALPTTESSIQLPLDRWFAGPFHDDPQRTGTPRVAALLGVRAPEAKLQIQVVPLDEAGEPLLGSQVAWRAPVAESTDYVAVVEMPEFPLSEADLLLAQGHYADAVAMYEQHIAADPDDIHSLEVLAYMFLHGTDGWGTLKDEERAHALYARIAELKKPRE